MSAKLEHLVIRHDAAARRCSCGKHGSVNTDAPASPPPEFTFNAPTTPTVEEPPAPALPKLAPLPNSLAARETAEERALPAWRRPLDGELKRRRR